MEQRADVEHPEVGWTVNQLAAFTILETAG